MEPSWMASHIYDGQSLFFTAFITWRAYRLGASVEYSPAVEVLVVFDGVAVLDDALGATVVGRGATGT